MSIFHKRRDDSDTPKTSFVRGYKQFWPFIKPYWFLGILGILLTIPVGALDAVVASFLKPFMDSVLIEQERDFSAKVPLYIVGFSIVQGLFLYAAGYVNSYVGGRISLEIKRKLYRHLLGLQTSYYDSQSTGSIYFGFSMDADLASGGLIDNIKLVLTKFFSCAALVCVLIYNSWQLSLYAVGILLVLFWPMSVVRRRVRKIMDEYVEVAKTVVTRYNETSEGSRVIKIFNLKDHQRGRFAKMVDHLFKIGFKMTRDTNWLAPVMHLVTAIGVAGALYLGLHLILTGVITPGSFVAFIAALLMLYAPVKTVGNNFISVQQSLLALDRIYQKLAITSYEQEDQESKIKLEGIHEGVSFEDVHFSYHEGHEILKGISFEAKAGTKLALVGNSGGGKSTVCALIPRFYDATQGIVKIDGHDVKDVNLTSLRDQIAVVFQDNFLFDGSIRDNLLCGKADATDEELQHALHLACLDEFMEKQEHGLDTQIGERGLRLSGGQKQRLAIARAILKNAPLVILDEATSALDNRSEKIVQKALDSLMEGRTTIVIAHRLSTVMDADKILVINDGRIVEEGNHEDLLKQEGAYAALYKAQFIKTAHQAAEANVGEELPADEESA